MNDSKLKSQYHVLGVMSGTSLDGIDLAEIFFNVSEQGIWTFQFGAVETIPYPEDWKPRLREAVNYTKVDLDTLDRSYTFLLVGVIGNFIAEHNILDLDAVCSHGHTIRHQPEKGVTFQAGNQAIIAHHLQRRVVCDFRVQDVQLGGQGAPLVPIGDRLLFGDYDYCLNIGGFANLSKEENKYRIAYDICPVNIVLNRYAETLGPAYDEGGKIAASGKVDEELLQRLNALKYYSDSPPKSLGLEWVDANVFPILNTSELSPEDILATFTEHVAIQLAAQFSEGTSVFITGGGVYNDHLLKRLMAHREINVTVVIPAPQIIEYKEALIFGLLGVLKLRNEVNCLASVTGAERDHSAGIIHSA